MPVDVVVVAVHPDDEMLGAGGAILRHLERGDRVHWVIVTAMTEALGFTAERIAVRRSEIEAVHREVGFKSVVELGIPTTKVSEVPDSVLVGHFSRVFSDLRPHTVYLPFHSDAHSDHRSTFQAAFACTKSFRYPSVRRVLMMETISETEFSVPLPATAFLPNVYVDISSYLEDKLRIVSLFRSEIGSAPFPRSPETLRALAAYRGSVAGSNYAEAFVLLRELVD